MTPAHFNILEYFPILAFVGIFFTFWNQSKNLIIKIFIIFWKVRVLENDFAEKFYKALYDKSRVINFDDYNLLRESMFSVQHQKCLPLLFKAFQSEIFLYRGFIPIFLTG